MSSISKSKVVALENEIRQLRATVTGLSMALKFAMECVQTEIPSPILGAPPQVVTLLDVWMRRSQPAVEQPETEAPVVDEAPAIAQDAEPTDQPLVSLA